MTYFLIISLTLATVLTAIISGVVGMAGGVTLLSFMTFFLSVQVIIPIHGVVQLTSNSARCFFLRKSIASGIFWRFFLGAPLGALGAYFVIKQAPSEKFFLIPITIIIFYVLLKPKFIPALKIPLWSFTLLGLVAGFMAPLIGATGPLLAPFFLRDDLTKEQIIATKAIAQSITHLLKIPLFLSLAFPYLDYAALIICMIVAAIIGSKIGVILLGHVSQLLFRRIYQLALWAAGIRLLFKLFL